MGRLEINGNVEDVTLGGHANIYRMGVQGTITFDSRFTVGRILEHNDPELVVIGPEATFTGDGVSRFPRTTISTGTGVLRNAVGHQTEFQDSLTMYGNVINNGVILADSITVWEGVLSGDGILVSGIGLFGPATLSPGDGIGTMPVFGRVVFSYGSMLRIEFGLG